MFDNFNPNHFFIFEEKNHTPIYILTENCMKKFYDSQTEFVKKQLDNHDFNTQSDFFTLFTLDTGQSAGIIYVSAKKNNIHTRIIAKLDTLPKYIQSIQIFYDNNLVFLDEFAYLWASNAYRFSQHSTEKNKNCLLYLVSLPENTASKLRALFLGRNLINAPAQDATPYVLQSILEGFANEFDASCESFVGSQLLDKNFNLIHAVGRAINEREREPRLIDFRYSPKNNSNKPTITLVGKGVCFDSGGLNLKNDAGMLLMKKDMGGAATVIAVMLYLLLQKPDYNLRVLIPAVENNVSANSFRPGDIYQSYAGKTVEITNTDAEGRLILADAIAYAQEEKSDLLIDIATLTGAARVALGPDLPAMITNNHGFARKFMEIGLSDNDPVWHLPLWNDYEEAMHGTVSDLINSEAGGMAGAIKAALFLKNFVKDTEKWVHFDSFCYNPKSKTGKPKGGEVMPFTTLIHFINHFVENFKPQT